MAASESKAIRVMSFNVRTSNASDGANGWEFRRELFFQTIAAFDPDLLGMQEVTPQQHDDVVSRLKDYQLEIGRAHV